MLKSLWGTSSSQDQNSESTKDEEKKETESGNDSAGAVGSLSYWTKGLGGLMSSVGDYANSLKETVTTTVQTTVESTAILSEFDKEQKKFERERQRQKDTTVPPWVGFNEEEQMKAQILELSADSRNVLRAPPPGIQFHFDFAKSYPVAMALLKEDPRLQKLRFELVPKKVKEEQFWLNYFYRVFLIKQSSQLASLATETKSNSSVGLVENLSDEPYSTTSNPSLDHSFTDLGTQEHGHQDISEDFASDALVAGEEGEGPAISRESVQAELHQLGIKSTNNSTSEQDAAGGDEEWAQLSRELEDLGLDAGEEDGEGGETIGEEEWEQELNQMLEGQSHDSS